MPGGLPGGMLNFRIDRRITLSLSLRFLHLSSLSAERRMGKEDGGLARHTIECQRSIDWTNAKIVATERGLRQRKVLEGIESLRQKHRGMKVLNSFDHVETWKSILNSFFDREGDCNSQ